MSETKFPKQKIALVEYKAGNISSVQNALSRLGQKSIVTNDSDEILSADKVILPGVGEAQSAMKSLKETQLDQVICSLKQPVLGICLGMQLLCLSSEEGAVDCLGIFNTTVKRFPLCSKVVPHMGWNNFSNLSKGVFFKDNVTLSDDVYYAHSYYSELCSETTATCDYILPFSAVLQKDNFFATQFHPEKSAEVGKIILSSFLNL